jgi:GTP pyrophosphokinase
MKEEKRKKGEIGKEMLERKLRHLHLDFEESADTIVKFYGYPSRTELYFALAMEERSIQEIFRNFKTEGSKLVSVRPTENAGNSQLALQQAAAAREEAQRKLGIKPRLLINGEPAERYQYSIATCCNPVQGDEIFAYLTASAGLKIHRLGCPNATHLMANYGYRVMKAEWVFTNDVTFIAELRINGVDSGPGVIERLTHQISTQLGLDIRSLTIEGDEGYFEGIIKIKVRNTDQLNMAIRALQTIDNISAVTRAD